MGKRVNGRFFIDRCVEGGSHGCNYLLTVNIEMEPVDGFQLARAGAAPLERFPHRLPRDAAHLG